LWAFKGQAVGSVWAQGGTYLQTLLALELWVGEPTLLVTPQRWKKSLDLEAPKGSTTTEKKRITLNWAREKFPWVEGINLQKHDGRADALAIAYYGYCHHTDPLFR
jgi:hypothetical protein